MTPIYCNKCGAQLDYTHIKYPENSVEYDECTGMPRTRCELIFKASCPNGDDVELVLHVTVF